MTTHLSQLPDEILVEMCLGRKTPNSRPFSELFRRYQAAIWRACYRFVGNPQDAEDLMQEVFFKAYRGLPRFQGESSFKTWLYQITTNVGRNELRRRSRRPSLSDTPVGVMAEILPADDTVEKIWARHARLERLEQAYEGLRSKERDALRLKDFEGRPYTEIAQILEISLSAAKMRVLRARLMLQKAYSKQKEKQISHETY